MYIFPRMQEHCQEVDFYLSSAHTAIANLKINFKDNFKAGKLGPEAMRHLSIRVKEMLEKEDKAVMIELILLDLSITVGDHSFLRKVFMTLMHRQYGKH